MIWIDFNWFSLRCNGGLLRTPLCTLEFHKSLDISMGTLFQKANDEI
jgi:hypothetical protein